MDNLNLYTKISALPKDFKQEVLNYIDFLIYKSKKQQPTTKKRHLGKAKGLIEMKDNFDDPIDDFKEYML